MAKRCDGFAIFPTARLCFLRSQTLRLREAWPCWMYRKMGFFHKLNGQWITRCSHSPMRGWARRLNYMLLQPSPLRNHLHCQGVRSWHRRPWQLFSSPGQQKETNTCASLWMSPRAPGVGAIAGQCLSTLVRHWATVLLRGSTKSRSWDYSIATESGRRGSIEIVKWNISTIGAARHHIYCFFQVDEEVILESGTWCICSVPDRLASRAAEPRWSYLSLSKNYHCFSMWPGDYVNDGLVEH